MRAAAAEAGCTRRREASGWTRRRGREASQVQGHEGAPLDNSTVYCTFTAVHDGSAKYVNAHNTRDMLNSVKYEAKSIDFLGFLFCLMGFSPGYRLHPITKKCLLLGSL